MKRRSTKINPRENGLVSIVIVTIVIVILALITTGFTKIMDRSLRQSLDRELSLQDNYAAEAGLNDAKDYIANAISSGNVDSVDTNGQCKDLTAASTAFVQNGSVSGNFKGNSSDNLVKYTCVIISTKVKQINTTIPAGHSKIFKIYSTPTIDNMYFGWQNKNLGTPQALGSPHELPRESAVSADQTGVLRTTIYPVPASAAALGDQNTALSGASRTYFMYPNSGSGTPGSVNYSRNGVFVDGNCKTSSISSNPLPYAQDSGRYCNSAVKGLGPVAPPPVTPASLGKKGSSYSTCTAQAGLPVGFQGCRITTGGGVYSYGNYTANYSTNGLPAGDYKLTLHYGNFRNSAWPPVPCSKYNFNVNVLADGVTKKSNWQLSPCSSSAIINLNGLQANPKITFDWDNNEWISDGSNPFAFDPNFEIDQFTLDQIVPPVTPPPAAAFYYVRLTALYHDLNVSVQASDSGDSPIDMGGAQVKVDVTAEGNDVLKRLEAAISLGNDYDYPNYTVESMDTICKRLRLPKTSSGGYGDAIYNDAGTNTPGNSNATENDIAAACSAGGILSPG